MKTVGRTSCLPALFFHTLIYYVSIKDMVSKIGLSIKIQYAELRRHPFWSHVQNLGKNISRKCPAQFSNNWKNCPLWNDTSTLVLKFGLGVSKIVGGLRSKTISPQKVTSSFEQVRQYTLNVQQKCHGIKKRTVGCALYNDIAYLWQRWTNTATM